MLIFVVPCASLHTLQGASIPPPSDALSPVASADTLNLMVRESLVAPANGNQQLRTVYSIVQSCLLTIFACVWTSAHPNINGPTDSGWTCAKRRVILMLCTAIAPELVLYWSFRQYFGAKKIVHKYNKEFARSGETKRSLWEKALGWFQPLPQATARRVVGQPWTTTHGFFIQMGGFMLYEGENPEEALDYDRLAQLLREKAIDPLGITESDLQDRSKGDTVSKGITVLQTTWFVTQCVVRKAERLSLSELEVLTLAFAVMNAMIYAVWWGKPQGVETSVCIPLKRAKEKVHQSPTPESMNKLSDKPENLPQSGAQSANNGMFVSSPSSCEQHPNPDVEEPVRSWLWHKIQQDHRNHSLLVTLVYLPFRTCVSVIHLCKKLNIPLDYPKKSQLRMPMFYSDLNREDDDFQTSNTATSFLGTIYSAIHLIAWVSEFPSFRDLVLWRVSATVVTLGALLLLLTNFAVDFAIDKHKVATCFKLGVCLLLPFYVPARFSLIVIAFRAISQPSQDVLLDVSWPSYIPHL